MYNATVWPTSTFLCFFILYILNIMLDIELKVKHNVQYEQAKHGRTGNGGAVLGGRELDARDGSDH